MKNKRCLRISISRTEVTLFKVEIWDSAFKIWRFLGEGCIYAQYPIKKITQSLQIAVNRYTPKLMLTVRMVLINSKYRFGKVVWRSQ
jgi:hypothetical protein